jgi:hypothetical protein
MIPNELQKEKADPLPPQQRVTGGSDREYTLPTPEEGKEGKGR